MSHSLERFFKRIQQRLETVEIVSLDVFDTVLTRTIGDPHSLFFFLGGKLNQGGLISLSAEIFARARLLAARRARRLFGRGREISLEAIYQELVHAYPELRESLDELIAAELSLEASVIVPVPGADEMVRAIRNHCLRIVFISDMYLPEWFLRDQLRKYGLIESSDALYVSCESGYRKAAKGELFRHVLNQESIATHKLLHIGDDHRVDVLCARAVGIHAVAFTQARVNRYERAMEADCWEQGGGASLFAGASRLARLRAYQSCHDRAFADVLAGVAAPLFVSFSLWLLQQLRRNGIATAYFLAREGEVLFESSRILNERFQFGLDLRYLYVSRKSINGGVLTFADETNVTLALTHSTFQTIKSVLRGVGLSTDSVREELESAGFGEMFWNIPLNKSERERFLQCLASGRLRERIEEMARPIRDKIEAYLSQEGFFQPDSIAVVDTTGNGSQMRALHLLRKAKSLPDLEGFLMVRNWKQELIDREFPVINAYISDSYAKKGWTQFPGLVQMLEVFSTTDYGTVLGYESRQGGVCPVLDTSSEKVLQGWPVKEMRKVIRDFATNLDLSLTDLNGFKDLRPSVLSAFRELWDNPTLEEAHYWGSFPFEAGLGQETDYIELAPRMGVFDLLNKIQNKPPAHFCWYSWPSAAWQRSTFSVRTIYRLLRRLKHLR